MADVEFLTIHCRGAYWRVSKDLMAEKSTYFAEALMIPNTYWFTFEGTTPQYVHPLIDWITKGHYIRVCRHENESAQAYHYDAIVCLQAQNLGIKDLESYLRMRFTDIEDKVDLFIKRPAMFHDFFTALNMLHMPAGQPNMAVKLGQAVLERVTAPTTSTEMWPLLHIIARNFPVASVEIMKEQAKKLFDLKEVMRKTDLLNSMADD